MDETTIAGFGFIIVAVTHLLVSKWLTQKQATLILATICGVGYYIYNQFVQEATKGEIIGVVTSIIGSGKLLYDLFTSMQKEKEELLAKKSQ